MTERDITDTIIRTHSDKFVCVPQCKTGATWGGQGLGIIDLWAMKKSYAQPLVIVYEIKTSRSDFLNDNKWHGYLDYCNEFYFVLPNKKIATPEEMPELAGLKYVSKTGTKLYTKKKAVYRNIEIPDSIYKYILISRSSISSHDININKDKALYWRNWLKTKELNRQLGFRISKELRETINGKMEDLERTNSRLIREIEGLANIKEYLDSININYNTINTWGIKTKIEERLKEIESGFSKEFIDDIEKCIYSMNRIKKNIERRN